MSKKYEEMNFWMQLIWITVVHLPIRTMRCGWFICKLFHPAEEQSPARTIGRNECHRVPSFPLPLEFAKKSISVSNFSPVALPDSVFSSTSRSIWWFFKGTKNCIYIFSIAVDKNSTRRRLYPPSPYFGKKGGNGAKNSYFFHTVFALWLIKRVEEGDESPKNHLVPSVSGKWRNRLFPGRAGVECEAISGVHSVPLSNGIQRGGRRIHVGKYLNERLPIRWTKDWVGWFTNANSEVTVNKAFCKQDSITWVQGEPKSP